MIEEKYQPIELKNFYIKSLHVEAKSLKGNALKDPSKRVMPILVPKKKEARAVVWVIAGFSGNGPNYLNLRGFESNFAENIDRWCEKKQAPDAIYIFVDAWTKLGGSQFINSSAVGNYEDYIVKDLYPLLNKAYPNLTNVVMGGSSGGYGALHLASKFPKLFPYTGAIAPDAFFEALFLPEFYKTKNFFNKINVNVEKMIETGDLFELRDWHSILNVYAMSACYSPNGKKVEIPFDFHKGQLISKLWQKWQKLDPVHFLQKRVEKIRSLKGVFLEVGTKDQFNLQFGARQIHENLKAKKIHHHYNEFDGGHFDLSSRRSHFLKWLNEKI